MQPGFWTVLQASPMGDTLLKSHLEAASVTFEFLLGIIAIGERPIGVGLLSSTVATATQLSMK